MSMVLPFECVTFERLFADWLERDYNKALEETKAKLEESDG